MWSLSGGITGGILAAGMVCGDEVGHALLRCPDLTMKWFRKIGGGKLYYGHYIQALLAERFGEQRVNVVTEEAPPEYHWIHDRWPRLRRLSAPEPESEPSSNNLI